MLGRWDDRPDLQGTLKKLLDKIPGRGRLYRCLRHTQRLQVCTPQLIAAEPAISVPVDECVLLLLAVRLKILRFIIDSPTAFFRTFVTKLQNLSADKEGNYNHNGADYSILRLGWREDRSRLRARGLTKCSEISSPTSIDPMPAINPSIHLPKAMSVPLSKIRIQTCIRLCFAEADYDLTFWLYLSQLMDTFLRCEDQERDFMATHQQSHDLQFQARSLRHSLEHSPGMAEAS